MTKIVANLLGRIFIVIFLNLKYVFAEVVTKSEIEELKVLDASSSVKLKAHQYKTNEC